MDNEKIDRIAEDCAATRANILNLKDYVVAVSLNVAEVRRELAQHKESQDAHGRRASEQAQSILVAWLAVVVAGMVGVADYLRGHH
jgi:hypothetical protein